MLILKPEELEFAANTWKSYFCCCLYQHPSIAQQVEQRTVDLIDVGILKFAGLILDQRKCLASLFVSRVVVQ